MDAQDGSGEEGGVKEEGGGWEVEEDLDLPPELVSEIPPMTKHLSRHRNRVDSLHTL